MPSLECMVCLESYNENIRVPRTLSCSHVFCTSCIMQVAKRESLKCPYCRRLHDKEIISSVDIPINQELMSIISENTKKETCETINKEELSNSTDVEIMNTMKLRADILKANGEGRCVYAMLQGENNTRYAKLSIRHDRLHLHSLTNNNPPDGSHIISYNSVRELANEAVVFFEISWNDNVQGNVYIRLLDDAGRTYQFLYLCTGEKGPSYLNTKFFEVTNKDSPGEQVWGGDYENNDGTGGAALPNMYRGPKHFQDVTAGLIAGYYFAGYGSDHNPSQFGIYIKDMPGYTEISSIGKVLSGLDIICSTGQLPHVHDASVSECGLVLFH